jgi:hypothetical protein
VVFVGCSEKCGSTTPKERRKQVFVEFVQETPQGLFLDAARIGEFVTLQSPAGSARAVFRGHRHLRWEVKGRITKLNGRVVNVDISGLPETEALQIVSEYSESIEGITWRAVVRLDPVFLASLAKKLQRPIFLIFGPFRGPSEQLERLSVLNRKIRGFHFVEASNRLLQALPRLTGPIKFIVASESEGKIGGLPKIDLGFLRNLPNLRVLSLVGFKINGKGMQKIGEMNKLKKLIVTGVNSIACESMSSVCNNRKLSFLLANCLGEKAARKLRASGHVRYVSVERPAQSGLRYLARIAGLRWLDIGDCRNAGADFWHGLRQRSRIRRLGLGHVPARGLKWIGRLGPSLRWLTIDATTIDDHGLAYIARLKQLRGLRIHSKAGKISDEGIAALRDLEDLVAMEVSSDEFIGKGLRDIGEKGRLKWLKINGSKCTEAVLEAASSLKELVSLSVSCLGFSETRVPRINLPNGLIQFDALGTQLESDDLRVLRSCKTLRYLSVGGKGIDNHGMQWIGRLKNLRMLRLNGTQVDSRGAANLAQLTNLRVLDLSHVGRGYSRMDGTILKHVRRMKNLMELDLTNVRGINDEALAHIRGMPNLREMILNVDDLGPLGFSVFRTMPLLRKVSFLGQPTFGELLNLGHIPTLELMESRDGLELERKELSRLKAKNPQCRFLGFYEI